MGCTRLAPARSGAVQPLVRVVSLSTRCLSSPLCWSPTSQEPPPSCALPRAPPHRVPGWGASSRWAVRDRAGGMQDLVALMSPHLPGRISPLASGSVPAMSLVFRDDLTSGASWGRNLQGVTLGPGSMSRPHSWWYVLCPLHLAFLDWGERLTPSFACSSHV